MDTAIQKNIKKLLEKKQIKVGELEKKAGLKQSAIQNILNGRSKRPGVDIISAIAKECDCTMEEIINPEGRETVPKPPVSQKNPPWNSSLFIEATQIVHKLLNADQKPYTTEEILYCIKEVYDYTFFSNQGKIDKKFAEWIIDRHFKNNL